MMIVGKRVDDMTEAEFHEAAREHLETAHRWLELLRARYPEESREWRRVSVPMTCIACALEEVQP